jgi:hypothetical protein
LNEKALLDSVGGDFNVVLSNRPVKAMDKTTLKRFYVALKSWPNKENV